MKIGLVLVLALVATAVGVHFFLISEAFRRLAPPVLGGVTAVALVLHLGLLAFVRRRRPKP